MPDPTINKTTVPVHVGIIMDGNGRWAQKRKLPRTAGHKVGVETARNIMKAAKEIGVKYLTLYTFSTENWSRTEEEVGFLMNLIRLHLKNEREFYKKENIRMLHLGDISRLSNDLQKDIQDVIEDSKNNTGLNVVLALNYGGRDEIIRAIKKLQANLNNEITEDVLTSYLDIPDLPNADLIIRTGGEKRLSNFLMWQSAYSELEFSDCLWPDYTKEEFNNTIQNFQNRNRRYGGI